MIGFIVGFAIGGFFATALIGVLLVKAAAALTALDDDRFSREQY